MARVRGAIGFAIVLALLPMSCGRGAPEVLPPPALDLTRTGACGDAFFWAASASDYVALTFRVEARGRSEHSATVVRFSVPSAEVFIEVVRGSDLSARFCTDLPQGRITSTAPVAAGRGQIMLDPLKEANCGAIGGTLRAAKMRTADGVRFGPVHITSDQIGCYSG